MQLEGSCHCNSIRFSCESSQPVPFLKCYCSICRKLNGSGGYGINIGADFNTIQLIGEEFIDVYHATTTTHYSAPGVGKKSGRHFCNQCSSGLWNWDERWPSLFHPYPSIIDTQLPQASSTTHIMLNSKASWMHPPDSDSDKYFDEYPDESLQGWHERMGYVG